MKFLLSIAKLLLAGSIAGAAAKTFDLIPAGWRLAWENVTLSDRLELSRCVLVCEVTKRCVGGRLEAASDRCHLTFRSDDRWLAMYEQKSAGADRVFGVTCDPKTGFYNQPEKVILGYNIEIHTVSMEECITLCERRFWCRTLERQSSSGTCYLHSVGNTSLMTDDPSYDFKTRVC